MITPTFEKLLEQYGGPAQISQEPSDGDRCRLRAEDGSGIWISKVRATALLQAHYKPTQRTAYQALRERLKELEAQFSPAHEAVLA